MAAPQASSRLEMLQARFQQRQLAEKEQKLLQLYDQQQIRAHQVAQRGSAGSNGSNHGNSLSHHRTVIRTTTSTHATSHSQGGGKVRQMFDERRQTTGIKGIDKSYPLEPLDVRGRKRDRTFATGNPATNTTTLTMMSSSSSTSSSPPLNNVNAPGNRRSVVTRKIVRAEAHAGSSINDKKPTITYREEVSQELEGDDSTEFNGENLAPVCRYENGNRRNERPDHLIIEDVTNGNASRRHNETIAKIHTTEFDRSVTIENHENEFVPYDEIVDESEISLRRTTTGVRKPNEIRIERQKNFNDNSKCRKGSQTINRIVGDVAKKRYVAVVPPSRVAKSQSPEIGTRRSTEEKTSRGATETSVIGRSAPSSPAKSPDTINGGASLSLTSRQQQQQQQQQQQRSSPSRPSSALSTASSRGHQSSQINSKNKMSTAKTRSATFDPSPKGAAAPIASKIVSSTTENDGLVSCKICGRRFNSDRVTRHEQICQKTTTKKRKQFDATIHRTKGTELEPFVKKVGGGGAKKAQADQRKSQKPEVKSNWRRKHEDFINAIRSAKQMQAHIAAGGKLSDLPPPPPSDTSDYIQCPHCGRKFNQAAAERHIPKCQSMLHNKPNPRAPPKPKR